MLDLTVEASVGDCTLNTDFVYLAGMPRLSTVERIGTSSFAFSLEKKFVCEYGASKLTIILLVFVADKLFLI